MREKIKVRKAASGAWLVSAPPIGFSGRVWYPHPTHEQALAAALGEIARRIAPTNLYASTSMEGWAPWTLKAPRI